MELGDRVQERAGKEQGTLRWRGTLEGTEGEWLGIEWDSGSRGKHRGQYKGTEVFQCRWKDSSGSFVRPSKVQGGRCFADAVRERYSPEEQGDAADAYVLTESDQKVGIEFVGEKRAQEVMANFSHLPTISLCGEQVSTCDPGAAASVICPKVRHVDLRGNLFRDWSVVETIVADLQRLRCLDLSENRMDTLEAPLSRLPANLSSLVLHKMRIEWTDVQMLVKSLKDTLRELSLCFNGLTLNGMPPVLWPALRHLSLANNSVTSWEDATRTLGALPALECLILNDNPLGEVVYLDGSFQSLKALYLGATNMASWASVSELARFPRLEDVRVSDTPIMRTVSATLQRYYVVARLPRLTILNGSAVSANGREDAEKYLLHICHKRMHTPADRRDSHLDDVVGDIGASHPLYTALLEKYGEPQLEKAPDKEHDTLASDFITLAVEKENEGFITEKKLPASMAVASLKALLSHLLDIPAADQVLFYKPQKSTLGVGEELDDDERSLSFYGMASGGCLLARQLDSRI